MRTVKLLMCLNLLTVGLVFSGCRRDRGEVWEDTKSASRYMGRGVRAMGGKHGDSRQISDPNDFYASNEMPVSNESEFIPLQDANFDQQMGMSEGNYPQPRETPGDPGSSIPGIEAFQDPSTNPALANIFQNIYFEYNSSLIKGQENLQIIRNAADYLRSHPSTYIFVEGHTDERGAEAYNLALGSHRANAVRNMIIKEGANADNIFSISYGKERPLVMENHEEAWSKNRRAEFKVYQR